MGFGGGGKKPPKLKIPASPFSTLLRTDISGPFATARSRIKRISPQTRATEVVTTSGLTPELQGAAASAQRGLAGSLGYLEQDPSQRFQSITGGSDIYYNALADQLRRQEELALGRAAAFGQSRGLANSTLQGSALAEIFDDRLKRERDAQLAAFNLGTQMATQNVGTNLGAISGLNNLVSPLAQLASSQVIQGRQFGDQFAAQKARAEYQSDLNRFNFDQQRRSGFGRAIGSLTGPIGGAIYSGITGDPAALNAGVGVFSNVLGAALPFFAGGLGGGLPSLGAVSAPAPGFSPTAQALSSRGFQGSNFI